MLARQGMEVAEPFPGAWEGSLGRRLMACRYRHTHHQGPSEARGRDTQVHGRVSSLLAPKKACAEPVCPRITNVMRLTCTGLPIASEHMTLRTLAGKGSVCVDTGVFTTMVAQQAVICPCKTKAK